MPSIKGLIQSHKHQQFKHKSKNHPTNKEVESQLHQGVLWSRYGRRITRTLLEEERAQQYRRLVTSSSAEKVQSYYIPANNMKWSRAVTIKITKTVGDVMYLHQAMKQPEGS